MNCRSVGAWALCALLGLTAAGCCAPLQAIMQNASLADSIAQAERKWQAQGISSYRIRVRRVQSIWHAQTYSVTVQSGQVVEQSAFCIPAPFEAGKCTVEPFDGKDYTVPGLFSAARSQAKIVGGKWTKIIFDEMYSFPKVISYDDPQVYDDDRMWGVESFEVLSQ